MASGHLLLVDDEPLLLMDIEADLEDAGFAVVSCVTGTSAVQTLESGKHFFFAVVTDIRLGDGLSGWDVALCARKIAPDIPIIYMSGDSAVEWTLHGVPNSVMLNKPFANDQITKALAQLSNHLPPTS